jgi:hypothetical protein
VSKEEEQIQKVNVSRGKKKINKKLRREELPFIRSLVRLFVVVVIECRWKNKKDKEAKKKRRKGIYGKVILVSQIGV